MNSYTINDGTTTYTRITRAAARRLYNSGAEVALCPCKLRPGLPWMPEARTTNTRAGVPFDALITAYAAVACNHSSGLYAAFYSVKEA